MVLFAKTLPQDHTGLQRNFFHILYCWSHLAFLIDK